MKNKNAVSFSEFVEHSRAMLEELIDELSKVYNNDTMPFEKKRAKFGLIAMNRGLPAEDFMEMIVA